MNDFYDIVSSPESFLVFLAPRHYGQIVFFEQYLSSLPVDDSEEVSD